MGLPTIHYQPTSYCSGRTLCELTATEVGLRNSGKSKKKMATWITLQPPISCYLRLMPSSAPSPASSTSRRKQRRLFKPFRCVPLQEQEPQLDQSQQVPNKNLDIKNRWSWNRIWQLIEDFSWRETTMLWFCVRIVTGKDGCSAISVKDRKQMWNLRIIESIDDVQLVKLWVFVNFD